MRNRHSFRIGISIALLIAGLLLGGYASAEPAADSATGPLVLSVAPNGNDAWSGRLSEPNAAGTDGPLATLRGARDTIRRLKKDATLPPGGVIVQIAPGVYRGQGLELSAEDSGSETAPVVFRAVSGGPVVFSAGRAVTGWTPVTDPAVLQRLDENARGKVLRADLKASGVEDFGQVEGNRLELFFNGERMTLARWPDEGFVQIVGLVEPDTVNVRGTKGSVTGKFIYEGDRPSRWIGEKEPWVHGYWFWDWSDSRHPVESIDTEKHVIAVKPPYHSYGYRVGQWYYALNLLSELDTPGEWYLDRETGILYFWPPSAIEQGEAVVSVDQKLIAMEGVSYVTLEGLILEHARGTAVTIRGGDHDRLAGCEIRNCGGGGVSASGREHTVADCHIHHLGDGGISLSGGDRKTLAPAHNEAVDNHIHHYGQWHRMYMSGISLQGVGNRAAHNLIHTAPHIGIVFGGNDHVIELNEVHHVCQESNDAGAMYAGRDWTMRGTVIRHNFLHHISGFRDRGCVGVYLDDMYSGTTITGNVFYEVTRAAFIGGGRDNTVSNNIFVDCRPALHLDARALGWAKDCADTTMRERLEAMPYQTPPWSERYPRLVSILQQDPPAPEGNLIERNVCVGGRWDEFYNGAEKYTTFKDNWTDADVRFVDTAGMNFQLPADSPVYEKVPGFEKIPFEQIGPRKETAR